MATCDTIAYDSYAAIVYTSGSVTASTTVRIDPETRARLQRLSRARGVSSGELIRQLVTQAEETDLLRAMNEDFAAARADEAAWGDVASERALWDATSSDGLPAEDA